MRRYIATFKLVIDGKEKIHRAEGNALCDFRDGFWISYDKGVVAHTKGSDCKYWIPASQLILIEVSGHNDK